jgi:hypothetical protein
MIRLLKCWTPWTHSYGWPQNGVQTCQDCGKTRRSLVEFPVNQRFAVPRYNPKAREETPIK